MAGSNFRGKQLILLLGILCLIAHIRSAPMSMMEPKTEEEILKTWNTYCPEDKATALKELGEKSGMAMVGNFEGGGMEIWCQDNDPSRAKNTKNNSSVTTQAGVNNSAEMSTNEKETMKN